MQPPERLSRAVGLAAVTWTGPARKAAHVAPGGLKRRFWTTAVVLLTLTGCGNPDYGPNVTSSPRLTAQKAEVWASAEGYPDILRLCIDGVAFATTMLGSHSLSLVRVPEWDASFCDAEPK
jgi:hypothetical protein